MSRGHRPLLSHPLLFRVAWCQMSPTIADVTYQLVMARKEQLAGAIYAASAHRELALELMGWFDLPTAAPVLIH